MEVDELQDIESKGLADLSEFEGTKKKIKNLEIIEVISRFDENGKPTTKERKIKVLKVETEPVEKDGQEFTATELFNLKYDKESGKWGVSTNEKSNLRKLMNKFGVKKVSELKGKEVILRIKPSGFLGFYY